jgi:hypothetical protein
VHLAAPLAPQHGARPQVRRTPGQLHGALPCVLGRYRTVEQTLALAVQITQHVGLQSIRQNAKQEVAGQVRVWSPPEYVMPTASKLPDVEIAHARDFVVERRSIRQCRTDHHAWHSTQAARRREGREADCAPLRWTMR